MQKEPLAMIEQTNSSSQRHWGKLKKKNKKTQKRSGECSAGLETVVLGSHVWNSGKLCKCLWAVNGLT